MCGFVGYIDGGETQLMEPVLHAMADRIRHRGPDWSGVYVDDGAILVHERLAIVDPAGGSQPLLSADGQLALAVNGEIYNHRELRAASDYAFTTGGVRRLTATVTAGNEASKQLLLKAGFRLEGELRENYWLNGRWHNDWLFGRLRAEGDAP